MKYRIAAVLVVTFAAVLGQAQTRPWETTPSPNIVPPTPDVKAAATPDVIIKASGFRKGIPIEMSTSLPAPTTPGKYNGTLGTVVILSGKASVGVLPGRVSAGKQMTLVEYMNGHENQRFSFSLAFTGELPQAVVAVGQPDETATYDVLAGILTRTKEGFAVRFDQRVRMETGKYHAVIYSFGPPRGFAEVMFDATLPGAVVIIPEYGIAEATPKPITFRYWAGTPIHAFIKRPGSFDAPVTLNFETDASGMDWLVTGDGRYFIPKTPTAPITRIVALFEEPGQP